MEGLLTTDRAVADEKETIALMTTGRDRGGTPMRVRAVDKALRNGPLTEGQKAAVKLILASGDRVVGVQGYAGSGKTTMLNRARALLEKRGLRGARACALGVGRAHAGEGEAAIEKRDATAFPRALRRGRGGADDREGRKGDALGRSRRPCWSSTRARSPPPSRPATCSGFADRLRIPRVVLVGDEKQLDAVDAGKPFAQLQGAGMKTAAMDQIMRQRDPALKEAVEASLAGDIARAFEKLGRQRGRGESRTISRAPPPRAGSHFAPEARERTGLMAPSHAACARGLTESSASA